MMKKLLVLVVVIAIALVSANAAFAVIAGSKHDMTAFTGATHSACHYCHTPHHPNGTVAPLWNRTLDAGGGFTAYGTTYSGTVAGQPGINSQTCLSCHDGSLGVGETWNFSETLTDAGAVLDGTGKIETTAAGYIGTDLTDDHPVGISYISGGVTPTQAGLANAGITDFAGYSVITGGWKIYGGGDNVGTVECASCHDPHSEDSNVVGATKAPFLKGLAADICTDCHSRK